MFAQKLKIIGLPCGSKEKAKYGLVQKSEDFFCSLSKNTDFIYIYIYIAPFSKMHFNEIAPLPHISKPSFIPVPNS